MIDIRMPRCQEDSRKSEHASMDLVSGDTAGNEGTYSRLVSLVQCHPTPSFRQYDLHVSCPRTFQKLYDRVPIAEQSAP